MTLISLEKLRMGAAFPLQQLSGRYSIANVNESALSVEKTQLKTLLQMK
jgi:hypothetical protein